MMGKIDPIPIPPTITPQKRGENHPPPTQRKFLSPTLVTISMTFQNASSI